MNHLTFLPNTTVLISKESIYLGSAVLVKVENVFYVLTAAHVPFGEECKQYSESLSSTLVYWSESLGELTFVRELGNLNIYKTHDIFAIEVVTSCENFPEIFFTSDTNSPQLQFIFRGRAKSRSGNIYSVKPCSKNGTTGADIHIEIPVSGYTDFEGEAGAEVLQGLSGSGVFIHDDDSNDAFLTSIVRSVSKDSFVGINSICISLFKENLIPELSLIDYEQQSVGEKISNKNHLTAISKTSELEALTRSITQNIFSKILPSELSGNSDLVVSRISNFSTIQDVPLPRAIASRSSLIDGITHSLNKYGTVWLYGSAGVGKTVSAKMAAKFVGGSWSGVNLRGLNSQEVCQVLASLLINTYGHEIKGILIDDLDCACDSIVCEKLLSLQISCQNANICLVFTSSKQIDEDYLFSANLPQEVEQKVDDFSEGDIKEIISVFGVTEDYWAKYIYMSSGGGHPQLVIAMIQSMAKGNWSIEEFKTLDSLFQKNESVEKVKKKTRGRLLHELPSSARKLIERVSLITGKFDKNLVLDLALLTPEIEDGGIIFDQLIGSWVDQHEKNRFSLSPLLSNYAVANLTKRQQKPVHYEIANSILRTKEIDPIAMNTVFVAAMAGENTGALSILCYLILTAELRDLQSIAPHLIMFTYLNAEHSIYIHDSNVNLMLRGSKLTLLTCFEDKEESYLETFKRFETEADSLDSLNAGSSVLVRIILYSKLLLSEPKFGDLPGWYSMVMKLNVLFENKAELLPDSIPHEEIPTRIDGISIVIFLIIKKINQIETIEELVPLFEFIDGFDSSKKDELFVAIEELDFNVDTIVSKPWLCEFDKNTIDCEKHSAIFSELEGFANSWGRNDLAESCVKFSAVIWDETGGRSDKAIEIIDRGLAIYGNSSFCLIRAKALILYREKNYKESLIISKEILAGKDGFRHSEKAYFYREAAICAENEGDFSLASEYFLLGSTSVNVSEFPDMMPMKIGLKADSALACWHNGEKKSSIQKFSSVLYELKDLDSKSSLTATHCHATCGHVLLWLEMESKKQAATLEAGDGVVVYPGIVSNPNPNEGIGKRNIVPIDLCWYMLDSIENYCSLNVGVSSNLAVNLSNGPIIEGEFIVRSSRLNTVIIKPNGGLLIGALNLFISSLSYASTREGASKESEGINFTYQTTPEATIEDLDLWRGIVEHYILSFVISCALQSKWEEVDKLVGKLSAESEIGIRTELINILKGNNINTTDAVAHNSKLVMSFRHSQYSSTIGLIRNVFNHTLIAVQIGIDIKQSNLISRLAFESLTNIWVAFWGQQRYLLRDPDHHFTSINKALSVKGYSWSEKILCLMKTILPTLAIDDELEVNRILNELLIKVRTKK